ALDVVGGAGDLHDHRCRANVENRRTARRGRCNDGGPRRRRRAHLHERRLALHRPLASHVGHLQHLDEAVELLDHLLHVLRVDDEGHPAHAAHFALANGEAVDVVAAPPEEAHGAVEHARSVLHQGDERVLHHALTCSPTSISPMLFPCGTIGKTFASRSTRKSITTDPSCSQALRTAGSTSSTRSTVMPRSPCASASRAKSGLMSGVSLYTRFSKSCCHCLTIPR